MKPISDSYTDHNFDFKLFHRHGDVCIFEGHHRRSPNMTEFEVFKVKRIKERIFNGKTIEAYETVPAPSAWGKSAFTVVTLERAQTRLNQLLQTRRIIGIQHQTGETLDFDAPGGSK